MVAPAHGRWKLYPAPFTCLFSHWKETVMSLGKGAYTHTYIYENNFSLAHPVTSDRLFVGAGLSDISEKSVAG